MLAYLSPIFLGHLKKMQSEGSILLQSGLAVSDIDFSQKQEKPEPMMMVFCGIDFFAFIFETITLCSRAILTECGYLTNVFKM